MAIAATNYVGSVHQKIQVWSGVQQSQDAGPNLNPVATWTTSEHRFAPLVPICMTSLVCEGWSGNGVWRTEDAGRTWTQQIGLSLTGPTSMSCSSTSACAVGTSSGVVRFTHDGGRTWTSRFIPQWRPPSCAGDMTLQQADTCGAEQAVTGLYCWSSSSCYATSAGTGTTSNNEQFPNGSIVETRDGGRTWSTMSIPGGLLVSDISCASHSSCWALAYTSASNDNGQPVLLRLH